MVPLSSNYPINHTCVLSNIIYEYLKNINKQVYMTSYLQQRQTQKVQNSLLTRAFAVHLHYIWNWRKCQISQLMRLWYLSHRRPAKAQVSLRLCTVSAEPSLFTHMKYGSRGRVQPKIRHLAPLDSAACTFEERVYGG